MSEEKSYPAFQLSIMDGPMQVVVRADTFEDFVKNLEEGASAVPLIDAFGEKMIPEKPQNMQQGVDLIKQELGGQVIYQGDSKVCQHGQMQWREGVSKAGKPYKMWACPMRNGGCDPIWVR